MKKMAKKRRIRNFEFHILWLPFLILFFVFTILPLISSVVLSFTDFGSVNCSFSFISRNHIVKNKKIKSLMI